MTARIRRVVLVLMALSGFALLGSSVQTVAGMDQELRTSIRALPAEDCPYPKTRPEEV